MRGCGAAAAAEHIDQSFLGEEKVVASHVLRGVVVPAHCVRQACVGVHVDEALGHLRQPLEEGPHLRGPKCAVEAQAERLAMPHGHVKTLPGRVDHARRATARQIPNEKRHQGQDTTSSHTAHEAFKTSLEIQRGKVSKVNGDRSTTFFCGGYNHLRGKRVETKRRLQHRSREAAWAAGVVDASKVR